MHWMAMIFKEILNYSGPLENHNVKHMAIKSMHLSKAFLSQVRLI